MKKFFDKVKSLRSLFASKAKDKPVNASAVIAAHAQSSQSTNRKIDRFTIISWVVTIFIAAGLLTGAVLYKNSRPVTYIPAAQPTSATIDGNPVQPNMPANGSNAGGALFVVRKLQLKTHIPERPRYEPAIYRVSRGDAMLSIAEDFKVKTESILYANPQMEDNPHNLKPGMELKIPPVDGLYYEWKDGDTLDSVAQKFDAKSEDIIDFPGNNIDLTDPKVTPGSTVMIPGGSRELRDWTKDLVTMGRGANTGTGGGNATNACGGGPVATGYGWPADDHTLSGNPYGPGHLGIDISAPEGSNVYAAAAGVVTMAQGGWNYGYGNVVQIDHGNGDVTVYAHLSSYIVGVCQFVGQGAVIGYSGNTGNSFGAHLHFEIRRGGSNINPYEIVQ